MPNNNTNKNMDLLIQKYGMVTIDYLGGGTWRIWFKDFHQHRGIGGHGSFASRGNSIEQAIMRLHESAKKYPPREGPDCRKGCPYYLGGCY